MDRTCEYRTAVGRHSNVYRQGWDILLRYLFQCEYIFGAGVRFQIAYIHPDVYVRESILCHGVPLHAGIDYTLQH